MRPTKEQQQENQIQSAMGRCVHFTGIQNATCKEGINYRELVGGENIGWAARIPCLLIDADKCAVVCGSRKLPSREEAEAEFKHDNEQMSRHMLAISAAHKHAKEMGFGKRHGGQTSMPCPLECGGRLHYSVAGYNGHMHAKCETPNCVSWME
jgi:hypothetical protein